MLGDEGLELADNMRLAAELELGLEAVLPGGKARLFEPGGLGHHGVFELDVRQRRPAPERERLPQTHRPLLRSSVPGLSDAALEAVDVDRIPRDLQYVAGRARDEQVCAEHLAQLRDEVLEGANGRLGRFVAPELVDESIRRDDLSCTQREEREQGALLLAAHVEEATVDADLEWPE